MLYLFLHNISRLKKLLLVLFPRQISVFVCIAEFMLAGKQPHFFHLQICHSWLMSCYCSPFPGLNYRKKSSSRKQYYWCYSVDFLTKASESDSDLALVLCQHTNILYISQSQNNCEENGPQITIFELWISLKIYPVYE